MRYLIFLTIFTLIYSCDTGRDRRRKEADTFVFVGDGSISDRNSNGDFNSGGDSGGDDGSTGGDSSSFDHCPNLGTNSYDYYHSHVGSYNICQSSTNMRVVSIQLKDPITQFQVCLTPTTHIMDSGERKATYIGVPKCFLANDSNLEQTITFDINRSGYTNRDLTGVMIMQDRPYYYSCPFSTQVLTVDAYLECMNVLAGLTPYYPPTPPACFNYPGAYCDSFMSTANQYQNYIDHFFDDN